MFSGQTDEAPRWATTFTPAIEPQTPASAVALLASTVEPHPAARHKVGWLCQAAQMSTCVTCELIGRRDSGDAPLWDSIRRTAAWDLVHAFGTSVEGWLVLVARRHITCVAEMSDEEAATLGPLIREVSRALHVVLDCEKTYVVQFAEHPDHPHVHVHVIPRARDLPTERRGPGIFTRMGSNAEESVSADRMDDTAARLSAELRL